MDALMVSFSQTNSLVPLVCPNFVSAKRVHLSFGTSPIEEGMRKIIIA